MRTTAAALILTGLLSVACGDGSEELSGMAAWDRFVEWDEALTEFDPDTVGWMTNIATSIPDELPEHALPQMHFLLQGDSPLRNDFIVASDPDRFVRLQLAIGNPSRRTNRSEAVLCFLNYRQEPCTPSANAWKVTVPGRSFAFLPVEIRAKTGDSIYVLLIPSDQPGYPFPASVGFPAFVDSREKMEPRTELPVQERVWPFEGCDVVHVLQEQPPINVFSLPKDVSGDTELFLLIELCHPDQIVKLIALTNRESGLLLDDIAWSEPLRIRGKTAVIPLDQAWFRGTEEFQVAVLKDQFGGGSGRAILFSDADSFGR